MELKELMGKKAELQIAPLIDVVFLLLIYFMVTSSLIKKEADLSFMLPAPINQSDPPPSEPIEVQIEVLESGDIMINGMVFGQDSSNLQDLVDQLMTLQAAAQDSNSDLIVNISPEDAALHGRIIVVMDACAAANVKNLSFSMPL